LINYLVDHGNYWGERYTKEQAREFVEREFVMSGCMKDGKFYTGPAIMDIER